MVPIERRIVAGKAISVRIHGEVDGGQAAASSEDLTEGIRRFYVFQGDSRRLPLPDGSVDYVVTDPPYYDSVQYSDLSNFFRVWLQLFLPDAADWSYDQCTSAVFETGSSKAGKYAEILAQIWRECARVLKTTTGRLIFTFHHWNPAAWAELTISLRRAGFVLINCYVVLSENPSSVHIRGLKALKHDSILVLRPKATQGEFPAWSKPSQIDVSDSCAFCRDCGASLGWFLNSNSSEEHIRIEWTRLLAGEENGKVSG
jgi:adenine-specific DNA methylase